MKLFSKACGIDEVFRLRVEDRNRSESYPVDFNRPYVVIGRMPEADLTLDHWQVSRRHAYLQATKDGLFCLDLGSRTGTHWEGRPSRWRWLTPQQPIHIGPYRISREPVEGTLSSGSSEFEREQAPGLDEASPVVNLHLLNDPTNEVWQISDSITLIGRSPLCQVRLSDPTLSKFHASLVRTPLGVWIVDLLGAGGVAVNQTRMRCCRLNEGDEFSIGQHQIRFNYETPNAYSYLVEEAQIPQVGSAIKRFESPGERGWVPANAQPAGLPNPTYTPNFTIDNPNVPESVAIAQALLGPMLNQFAVMQQQMFEQFHQTMMMMMQSMHLMHRERMDSVEKELAEVRRLTQELHTLQSEAAKVRASETVAVAPAPAPSPPVPPAKQPAPASSSKYTSPTPHRAPSPHSEPPKTTARSSNGTDSQRAAAASASTAAKPAQPRAQFDAHSALQQRINNLQTERQTRWQKILSMVGGGSEGRA